MPISGLSLSKQQQEDRTLPNIIYLVTHGDRELTANPGMTKNGFRQVETLRQYLPDKPTAIVRGTGRRHRDTADALRLEITRLTDAVGVSNAKNRLKNTIILDDGSEYPYDLYTGAKDREPSFLEVIASLPDNSVVITSRPLIKLLGSQPLEGKKATVYCFDRDTNEVTEIASAATDCETDDV